MFKIEGLSFQFDHEEIIQDLNFTMKSGTLACVIAPNGTGKTTLFRLIANRLKKNVGQIVIDGYDSHERVVFNSRLFFMEDAQRLTESFSALENLEVIKELWESTVDINEVVQLLQMESFQHKKVKKMSLGMRQKVLIAAAIVSDAQLLIFDEPLNALDLKNITLINALFLSLKKQGKMILLSSHNIYDLLEVTDNLYFLYQGKMRAVPNQLETIKAHYFELFN
ncbi:ABC transporter ATP-binding protein [Jeotgalibaca dankookensis]|nr:ABC transporter ATP-binding protein [Jeotgalibaca dankookensis]